MPKGSKLETHTLAIRRIAQQNHNVMAVTPRAAMSRQGADTKQRRYVQVCHIVIVDVEESVSNSAIYNHIYDITDTSLGSIGEFP